MAGCHQSELSQGSAAFDVGQHEGEGEGEGVDSSHGSVSLRYQCVRLSDNLKFTSAHTMPTTFSASALGYFDCTAYSVSPLFKYEDS